MAELSLQQARRVKLAVALLGDFGWLYAQRVACSPADCLVTGLEVQT